MGAEPLLKAVIAAIIGGLGSLPGAVVGGLSLGVAEVFFRSWLPSDLQGLTDSFVFVVIAVLFVVRPQGLFNVPDRRVCVTLSRNPRSPTSDRSACPRSSATSALLVVVLGAGMLYATGGQLPPAILLITDLFVNMVLVLGFQVFIGNTGVLSFGHLGIASIAPYTMALLAVPVDPQVVLIPNAPWGIPEIELDPLAASLVGARDGDRRRHPASVSSRPARRAWRRR